LVGQGPSERVKPEKRRKKVELKHKKHRRWERSLKGKRKKNMGLNV